MNYLITGGTGSIGQELVRKLLSIISPDDKIIIYSRDEAKQAEMARKYAEGGMAGIRYLVGDICDLNRLKYAMEGIDVCIHAAAMKRIDTCEYNPLESIRVNVHGSSNVAEACAYCGVFRSYLLSTDKACLPISAYGAQKAAAEHLWIGMNNMADTHFSVIRYGNVWGSRGSFLKTWKESSESGEEINITDERMTRFFWRIEEAAGFIIKIISDTSQRGCIYVPKMRSSRIMNIAEAFTDKIKISGMRCPEKIHEDLISVHESVSCYDQGDYYVIYPTQHDWCKEIEKEGKKVTPGFKISSGDSE
jgi:UDP-N-acetylglucosamine 4,6-dehydratase